MFKHATKQITEGESRELVLDSYVMYVHSHHCANCGKIEKFSQIFEVWCHPTKTRTTGLRDLRPVVDSMKTTLAMASVSVPAKKILFCAGCWVPANRAVGNPAPISSQAWAETLKRKYTPEPAEARVATKTASPAKVVPTLDQI